MYSMNPAFQKTKISQHFNNKGSLPEAHSLEEQKLNLEWYSPPQESIPVTFCLETSLHGLKYLGQRKRHIFERLFWLGAFVASVTISIILIWGMWQDYRNMPIITVFNPSEKNLDDIPFPSVTICNVNNLQKTTWDLQVARVVWNVARHHIPIHAISDEEFFRSLATLTDMSHICDSALSFIDRFVENSSYAKSIADLKLHLTKNTTLIEQYLNPTATLRNVSQPCHKMLLHCVWQDDVRNCSELFRPIETDYGYCCTFNTMPVSLLLKYSESNSRDNRRLVKDWKAEDLDYEKLIFKEGMKNRKYPLRQRYPGKLAGLSFLLDPDLDEYMCTNTDSEGFVVGINVPLDFPRMKDNGLAIKTNSEVFVGIKPEITISTDAIKQFPLDKRQCYYGNEFPLPHYTMYTASNCMSECIARKTREKCGCILFYMPHDEKDESCKPRQYNCTKRVQKNIIKYGLNSACNECLPTCTEIDYQKEVTLLDLHEKKVDELYEEYRKSYTVRDVSLVHVYLNTDSIYPRLRKELTTTTQLMSNAGGLLGLFLGFSVLSLLEIVYYVTMRACCNLYREKTVRKKQERNEAVINGDDEEPINVKQGWFSRFFNGTSNMETRDGRMIRGGEDEENNYHDDVFHVRNQNKLPAYFPGSFEDQFQRAFITSYPHTGYSQYPK